MKEVYTVNFEVSGSTVLVRMNVCENIRYTNREKAIEIFTRTWDETVEPLRERLTEISRKRDTEELSFLAKQLLEEASEAGEASDSKD